MKLLWIGAVLLFVVGVGAVAFVLINPGGATAQTTNFLTAAVTRTNVVDQVVATGTLSPATTYQLAFGQLPRAVATTAADAASSSAATGGSTGGSGAGGAGGVSWPVKQLNVVPGQHVRKGQLLATADTTARDAQIAAARAQLDAAETQLSIAPTTVALYNDQAQVAQATQSLAALQAVRSYPSLTAPADGTVTTVNLAAGVNAPSGTAITMISDTLVATAQVAEADVARVAAGQAANVTITALNASVAGKVMALAPSGSSSGGVVSFGVVISLSGLPAGARPGMSVQVAVTIASANNVLAIPAAAVQGTVGAYQARVLGADGQPQERSITVGLITSDLVEVRSGLQSGERVITGTVSALVNQAQSNQGGFGGLGRLGGGGLGRGRAAGGN